MGENMYPFHHHFQYGTTSVNWTAVVEAVSTVAAAVASFVAARLAYLTLRQLKTQLETEQEPFIVARDDISLQENNYKIKLKNVGRGPALHITGCRTSNEKERNDAFFMNDQSHSKNLCANNADSEGEKQWRVDKPTIDSLKEHKENNEIYKYFYFFYESQLGSVYYTKVKIKKDGNNFIVMENRRVKL